MGITGLTQEGTGHCLSNATADTLAVPIVPIGVAGVGTDGTVVLQGCDVQEHGHLVVTLEVFHALMTKGPRAVACSGYQKHIFHFMRTPTHLTPAPECQALPRKLPLSPY